MQVAEDAFGYDVGDFWFTPLSLVVASRASVFPSSPLAGSVPWSFPGRSSGMNRESVDFVFSEEVLEWGGGLISPLSRAHPLLRAQRESCSDATRGQEEAGVRVSACGAARVSSQSVQEFSVVNFVAMDNLHSYYFKHWFFLKQFLHAIVKREIYLTCSCWI